jgi:hypothetical protein
MDITVSKRNLSGEVTWQYSGRTLKRGPDFILIEAFFDQADALFHGVLLKRGDRFLETYYTNRWYNIFEIYDRDTGQLKLWYCNIGYPAVIDEHTVSYRDLALDLLVYPDGRQLILDEEEFTALPLNEATRTQAMEALKELQNLFCERFQSG